MPSQISNPAVRKILEEIEQKRDYLKLNHGLKKQEVAEAIGVNDGNLGGYLNGSKPIDLNKAKALLDKLNEVYKEELIGFVLKLKPYHGGDDDVPPQDTTVQSDDDQPTLKVRIDEFEVDVEAKLNVLMRHVEAGTRPKDLLDEIQEEKKAIRARKNNPQ